MSHKDIGEAEARDDLIAATLDYFERDSDGATPHNLLKEMQLQNMQNKAKALREVLGGWRLSDLVRLAKKALPAFTDSIVNHPTDEDGFRIVGFQVPLEIAGLSPGLAMMEAARIVMKALADPNTALEMARLPMLNDKWVAVSRSFLEGLLEWRKRYRHEISSVARVELSSLLAEKFEFQPLDDSLPVMAQGPSEEIMRRLRVWMEDSQVYHPGFVGYDALQELVRLKNAWPPPQAEGPTGWAVLCHSPQGDGIIGHIWTTQAGAQKWRGYVSDHHWSDVMPIQMPKV